MSKKFFKSVKIVSLVFFLLLSMHWISKIAISMQRINTGIGIIGGADTPTLQFLLAQSMASPLFWLWCIALIATIVSGIVFFFTRKRGSAPAANAES